MKKLSIIFFSMLLSAATAWSEEREENSDWHIKGRVGYSIGGTAPIGMPATIRKLNKFELKPNLSVGVDVQKNFWGKWGLQGGLRFENKSMSIDATVKSYYMDLVRGGQSLDGRFTGRVITDARQWMFTVPVNATFQPSDRVLLYAGPYLSVLTSKSFEGNVYNGYLRKGNPTGEKVEIEAPDLPDGTMDAIAGLPFVRRISHDGTTIHLLCDNGPHNLANILGVLQQRAVVFGRVYSEPPTLNDVFLEITGKELRD